MAILCLIADVCIHFLWLLSLMTTFGGLKQHAFKETFFFFFCIYLWLCWVFVAAWAFSSCSEQGLLSKSQCLGSSLWWPLMLLSRGSGIVGSVVSTGSLVVVHWLTCSEATKGSFQTRGQTCVSCIGRWILYPWAPREAPTLICFFFCSLSAQKSVSLGWNQGVGGAALPLEAAGENQFPCLF